MNRLRKVENDAELIYMYYLLQKKEIEQELNSVMMKDEKGNKQRISDRVYQFLQDYYAGTVSPMVLSNEEYDSLQNEFNRMKRTPLYHGFRTMWHAANFLWDHNKHYGSGIYGSGFYMSDSKDEALEYTEVGFEQNPSKIVEMKLLTNENFIIDYSTLKFLTEEVCEGDNYKGNKHSVFLNEERKYRFDELKALIDKSDDLEFKRTIAVDESILAIYLGFDAVRVVTGYCKNFTILRPDKLVIKDSELKRVLSMAGGEYSDALERME